MNLTKTIKVELMKYKNSFIIYVLIAPIAISCLMLNMDLYFRKSYVLSKYSKVANDGFYDLIIENHLALIWPLLLLLFIILISISIFYIDLKNNCLTHLFVSPLKRINYYLAKWIMVLLFTVLVIVVEAFLLVGLTKIYNLSNNLDIELLTRYVLLQILTSLGFISVQIFLFSIIKDVGLLITVNVVAICASFPFLRNPSIIKFNPYLHFMHNTPFSDPNLLNQDIVWSIFYTILFTAIGIAYFKHQDIKEE
ncbi:MULTISPECIES: ABC transporter permease [Clostridium]|uniref:ABC transporter permease n=1 Tax=Clostridium frigoriphilum TaxID=443253 RepID=A0ABU7UT28_9CLOT|nr:ABC transporter permease [Clostridium sp. DSM 17811]MBU3101084.1 ABC transporter permease [Clostridium sp. DSM 17811]